MNPKPPTEKKVISVHSPSLAWAECDNCSHECFGEERCNNEITILCFPCLEKAKKEIRLSAALSALQLFGSEIYQGIGEVKDGKAYFSDTEINKALVRARKEIEKKYGDN